MPLPQWALALADDSGRSGGNQAALAAVASLPHLEDKALVAEAQAGSRTAFEELVRRYDRDVLRLAKAMERLSPRERVVFEMKHYQGLKLRAIGDVLGTTEETVKNSLFRATRKLRQELGGLR